jgi:hypothetical protein
MPTLENIELQKFYIGLQEDIKSQLVTDEEGNTPEQIFTEIALSYLSDGGETENYQVKYDEKVSKRGIEHKINAYALSENYETLDLFVAIHNGTSDIANVSKQDADKNIDRLVKFFRNAVYKDYINEIEESSQIFDFAHTLANAPEIKEFLTRVNVFLLTDGIIKGDFKSSDKIAGYTVYYRIIDINYLYNISEKSHVPIEIDFIGSGIEIPCIAVNSHNTEYNSYLAIVPGTVLASLYEQYGSRLLEQNVRSFLQFTGKINKGIRKTIIDEPQMFLAYNNGIAATADEVKIIDLSDGRGKVLGTVSDLQIVNGGQTTASIYHTWKKDKADISNIYVQIKLSRVNDKSKFSEIVSRISEYANTQNKVSVSDLSSNKPFHIELEKLSRNIWATPTAGTSQQTTWFYERARGQYKNAALKYGFTKAKRNAFELRNPRGQVFTKEDLAKYINSYEEVFDRNKLVIGPFVVVRGNQKNYAQFINYYLDVKPDNVFFEDTIAKAILFRTAEKIYGIKPNAIGDMRYITVPYSIGWLGYHTNYKLDLYKIWKEQSLSEKLKTILYDLMVEIEKHIRENAPGALYGEWAKKEECWISVKENNFGVDLSGLKSDLESSDKKLKRRRISDDEIATADFDSQLARITSVHHKIWMDIEKWGRETGELTSYLSDMAGTISGRIRNKRKLSESEFQFAKKILDFTIEKAPEIFYKLDELEITENSTSEVPELTLEIIKQVVAWDKKNKVLKDYEFLFMRDVAEGRKTLSDRNKFIANLNLSKVKRHGF